MQEKRISNAVIIFFPILWNYILFSYFFLNEFVDVYKNNLYFVTIFYFIIFFLLMIPIKKVTRESQLLKKIISKRFISYTISFYCFFGTILLLVVGVSLLKAIFFPNANTMFLLATLIITILIIARRGVKNMMNVSFIFIILTVILIFTASIINFPEKDYGMLLPHSYNFKLDFSFVFYIYMVLDIILIFITSNFYSDTFSKKTVFKALVGSALVIGVFSVDFVTMFGSDFLKDFQYIGSSVFEIQQSIDYLGDLDFLFLLILVFVIIFRSTYFTYLFKTLLKLKNKNNRLLIIGVFLFFVGYFFFINFSWVLRNIEYIISVLSLTLMPYYLFLIFRKKDEVNFQ